MKKIDEPNALNDVAEFHDTFELPVLDTPVIPPADRCRLRLNLLEEELRELRTAIEDQNLIEVADALCDLQYVLSGAILEFGLASRFKRLFEEVHRSNMSKVCETMDLARSTLKHYQDQQGTEGRIVEKNGQYLVYREGDNKVLKSVNYSIARLDEIIDNQ